MGERWGGACRALGLVRGAGVCDCGAGTRRLPRPGLGWPSDLCPHRLAEPGTRFPFLQQREPFKKRWFALDPQERRLLYYKNPLVRATASPAAVHLQAEVGSVLVGNHGEATGLEKPSQRHTSIVTCL